MMCFEFRYRIRKDGKFWSIKCLDYPVFTQGRTKKEAQQNLREAFSLYAEDPEVQEQRPELKRWFARNESQAVRSRISLPTITAVESASSFLLPVYESLTDFVRPRVSENPL